MEHREAQNETVEDACPEKVKKLFGLLNEHEVAYHGAGPWGAGPCQL